MSTAICFPPVSDSTTPAWSLPAPQVETGASDPASEQDLGTDLTLQVGGPGWDIPDCDIEEAMARRDAMMAALATRPPERSTAQRLARGVRYVAPGLVCVAACVWMRVLLITAISL